MGAPEGQLRRHFGLLQATALNMTMIVGAGVFIKSYSGDIDERREDNIDLNRQYNRADGPPSSPKPGP